MIRLIDLNDEIHLYYQHLLRLDKESRYLRFQGIISDESILLYVNKIQQQPNNFIIARFYENMIIGAAHMHCHEALAELAFSVEASYRGQKIAKNLFNTAIEIAKNNGCTKIHTDCFSNNVNMKKLAESIGLTIVKDGADASAYLNII